MTQFPPQVIRFLIALTLAYPSTSSAEEGYARGGPDQTGSYPGAKLPESPKTLWGVSLGKGCGEPVIAENLLIIGNRRGSVAAVRLSDGVEVWGKTLPDWSVYRPATVVDGLVYLPSNLGIHACRLSDGEDVWFRAVEGGVGGSPLVMNGTVAIGGNDGFAYAFHAQSGKELWKHDLVVDAPPDAPGRNGEDARGGTSRARPGAASSDGKLIYVPILDQSRVIALELKTGVKKWSFVADNWIGSGTTVAEGKVFFRSRDRLIHALNALNGKSVWTFTTRFASDDDLAYSDGSIYASSVDGTCYRINAKSGEMIWESRKDVGPDKEIYLRCSAPIVDSTAVYFGSVDGNLYALNRKDGTIKWEHKPRVDGERVGVCVTDGSRIYARIFPKIDPVNQRDEPGVRGVVTIGPK